MVRIINPAFCWWFLFTRLLWSQLWVWFPHSDLENMIKNNQIWVQLLVDTMWTFMASCHNGFRPGVFSLNSAGHCAVSYYKLQTPILQSQTFSLESWRTLASCVLFEEFGSAFPSQSPPSISLWQDKAHLPTCYKKPDGSFKLLNF